MKQLTSHTLATVFCMSLGAAWLLPSAALADVTVTSVTHFGGFMGMGANDTTSREYIQGDRKREESTMKFTGSILSKLAGTHKSVKIYRVDKNEIIQLKPESHSYTLLPMTVKNARQASNPNPRTGQSDRNSSGRQDQNHTRVIRNDLTVKATGKRKRISGYNCKEYLMTWLVVTEDTRTKQRSKSVMTSDFWTTPATHSLKVLKEDKAAYDHAYLKRLGIDLSPQMQNQFGLNMLGLMSGKSQKDLKKALNKIHGYPIETSVKWQSNAKDNESGTNNTAANGEQALKKVAGNLGNMLGGLFNHKAAAPQPAKPAAGDMKTIFSSTTRIKDVSIGRIQAGLFRVPPGYKKTAF